MKIKFLSVAVLGLLITSCGPSAAEQEARDENRETAEQELEDSFDDEILDMMDEGEELVEVAAEDSELDSSVTEERDSILY